MGLFGCVVFGGHEGADAVAAAPPSVRGGDVGGAGHMFAQGVGPLEAFVGHDVGAVVDQHILRLLALG
ncbi:hypothetical protein ABZ769_02770 [Streptomyces olivoreticuli]